MNINSSNPMDEASFWVFCLCAQWCGVCRGYETDFAALAQSQPETQWSFLDVEDAPVADALVEADLDVETFPYIVAGKGPYLLFSGAVLPQIKILERMHQEWSQNAVINMAASVGVNSLENNQLLVSRLRLLLRNG